MSVMNELILQCLIIDGRASFRRIADVVGVSEQTVARRVRGMHAAGIARVVVRPSGFSIDRRAWTVRITCRPNASAALADALAARDDVAWVALVSGGSEIICATSGLAKDDNRGVLARLPRTESVLSFSAHALLRAFAASTDEWTIFDERLDDDQVARLLRPADRAPVGDAVILETDAPLVAALARDGRATVAALARDAGWPATRVAARLDALLSGGALHVATDFLPEAFGYHASAVLYLTVPPGRIVSVAETLATHRETGFVAATSGSSNVFAAVTCKSFEHLFRYVSETVGALPDVQGLDLAPYLRRVKQTVSRVVDDRLVG